MSAREQFGQLPDGSAVERVGLQGFGLSANVMSWGAVLQDLRLEGVPHPLVLGFHEFASYPQLSPHFGAICGRVANRIAQGTAEIAGKHHTFDRNFAGQHTLHGGSDGCGTVLWSIAGHDAHSVNLTLRLPDGHMGFPGTLDIEVRYQLVEGPGLRIDLAATADAPTLCNLAHHSYFNLDGRSDIDDHTLWAGADRVLEVDEDLIPTGSALPVEGTEFDFRQGRKLAGLSCDHNLCLSEQRGPLRRVARLTGGKLAMVIETTEPGLQVYDGRGIDTRGAPGLGGLPYGARAGIALEPQAWPDAPNQPWRAQVDLHPGETYKQVSVFRFESHAP